jgi:hypothetical protein
MSHVVFSSFPPGSPTTLYRVLILNARFWIFCGLHDRKPGVGHWNKMILCAKTLKNAAACSIAAKVLFPASYREDRIRSRISTMTTGFCTYRLEP